MFYLCLTQHPNFLGIVLLFTCWAHLWSTCVKNESDLQYFNLKIPLVDIYRPSCIMGKWMKSTDSDWTGLAEARVGRTCYDVVTTISNNPTDCQGRFPFVFCVIEHSNAVIAFYPKIESINIKTQRAITRGLSQDWKHGTNLREQAIYVIYFSEEKPRFHCMGSS